MLCSVMLLLLANVVLVLPASAFVCCNNQTYISEYNTTQEQQQYNINWFIHDVLVCFIIVEFALNATTTTGQQVSALQY